MTAAAASSKGSLRLRFACAMLAWLVFGLLATGLGTSLLFRRHMEVQFHEELAVHLLELAALTRLAPDGRPFLDRPLSDPRFGVRGSGFYWQVERDGLPVLRSASMPSGALDPALAHQPDIVHRPAPGPTGPTMTYGFIRPAADGGPALHFLIATDERILNDVVSAFERALWGWLAVLAIGLFGTGTLALMFALKPLDRLGTSVAALRDGGARRMHADWPTEIAPLVADLNALLDTNDLMVSRARLEAGNLAHSLRTSLAILSDEAETLRDGKAGDSASTLLEQCRRIERQLDWHLARARAGTRHGAATAIPAAVEPIVAAMRRLHCSRGLHWAVTGTTTANLAIDPDDFAEIVSNLADNAGKWARSQVAIDWQIVGRSAHIRITDDGPGIPERRKAEMFAVGSRLDERAPGHGLGLAIARDLARHHGGDIALADAGADAVGLRAIVTVPLAATQPDQASVRKQC